MYNYINFYAYCKSRSIYKYYLIIKYIIFGIFFKASGVGMLYLGSVLAAGGHDVFHDGRVFYFGRVGRHFGQRC